LPVAASGQQISQLPRLKLILPRAHFTVQGKIQRERTEGRKDLRSGASFAVP